MLKRATIFTVFVALLGCKEAKKPKSELGFQLREASREVNLAFQNQSYSRFPKKIKNVSHLMRISPSVAVSDLNGDGHPDVYLTNSEPGVPNRLLLNDGKGAFTDASQASNIGFLNTEKVISSKANFIDFDNDGDQDLFLLTNFIPRLYLNNGNATFKDVTNESGIKNYMFSFASNFLDYNRDGLVDIVYAAYFKPFDILNPTTFLFTPNSVMTADNGGPIVLLKNNGDNTFTEMNLGLKSKGFVQAIAVYDFQDDGYPDLWMATDYNTNKLFLNDNGEQFIDKSDLLARSRSRTGMSATIATLDQKNNIPTVFVSHTFQKRVTVSGNEAWQIRGKGSKMQVKNQSHDLGIHNCAWSWAALFADIDNDSDEDLLISNGFMTGKTDKSYWYQFTQIVGASKDYQADSRNWPALGDYSWSGKQQNCLFLNEGNKFRNVANLTDFKDDDSDGRGLAAIDLLSDGSISLVEVNYNQPSKFYRNRVENRNDWVGFQLIGTKSNRNALGSFVKIYFKDRTLAKYVAYNNGFMSQSDARIHFGLGKDPRIQKIEVKWPTGKTQIVSNYQLNQYNEVKER